MRFSLPDQGGHAALLMLLVLALPAAEPEIPLAVADVTITTPAPALIGLDQALRDMLITDLSSARGIRLFERARLDAVRAELALQRGAEIDAATAVRLGKLVGVQAVLVGSGAVVGERLRLDVRLIHVESGAIVLADAVDGRVQDIFDLEKALVKKVIDALGLRLSAFEEAGLRRAFASSPEAAAAVARARGNLAAGDLARTSDELAQAKRLDPEASLVKDLDAEVGQLLAQVQERLAGLRQADERRKLIDRILAIEAGQWRHMQPMLEDGLFDFPAYEEACRTSPGQGLMYWLGRLRTQWTGHREWGFTPHLRRQGAAPDYSLHHLLINEPGHPGWVDLYADIGLVEEARTLLLGCEANLGVDLARGPAPTDEAPAIYHRQRGQMDHAQYLVQLDGPAAAAAFLAGALRGYDARKDLHLHAMDEIGKLITSLSDPEFVRENATTRLALPELWRDVAPELLQRLAQAQSEEQGDALPRTLPSPVWLGLALAEEADGLHVRFVASVVQEDVIAQGGRLVAVGGRPVRNQAELDGVLASHAAGDRVAVDVVGKDGRQQQVAVTVEAAPLFVRVGGMVVMHERNLWRYRASSEACAAAPFSSVVLQDGSTLLTVAGDPLLLLREIDGLSSQKVVAMDDLSRGGRHAPQRPIADPYAAIQAGAVPAALSAPLRAWDPPTPTQRTLLIERSRAAAVRARDVAEAGWVALAWLLNLAAVDPTAAAELALAETSIPSCQRLPDRRYAQHLVLVLGRCGGAEAAERLRELTGSLYPDLRRAAYLALGTRGGAESLSQLEACLATEPLPMLRRTIEAARLRARHPTPPLTAAFLGRPGATPPASAPPPANTYGITASDVLGPTADAARQERAATLLRQLAACPADEAGHLASLAGLAAEAGLLGRHEQELRLIERWLAAVAALSPDAAARVLPTAARQVAVQLAPLASEPAAARILRPHRSETLATMPVLWFDGLLVDAAERLALAAAAGDADKGADRGRGLGRALVQALAVPVPAAVATQARQEEDAMAHLDAFITGLSRLPGDALEAEVAQALIRVLPADGEEPAWRRSAHARLMARCAAWADPTRVRPEVREALPRLRDLGMPESQAAVYRRELADRMGLNRAERSLLAAEQQRAAVQGATVSEEKLATMRTYLATLRQLMPQAVGSRDEALLPQLETHLAMYDPQVHLVLRANPVERERWQAMLREAFPLVEALQGRARPHVAAIIERYRQGLEQMRPLVEAQPADRRADFARLQLEALDRQLRDTFPDLRQAELALWEAAKAAVPLATP